MNTFIRFLYALLIAAAIVTFVGVGIYTIYPGPTAPDPTAAPVVGSSGQQQEEQYQRDWNNYQNEQKDYSRKICTILVLIAVVVITGSIWLTRRSEIIGEGISLGGIATSIYGVVTASAADNRILRFASVSVFLAGTLVVVYFRFKEVAKAASIHKKKSQA